MVCSEAPTFSWARCSNRSTNHEVYDFDWVLDVLYLNRPTRVIRCVQWQVLTLPLIWQCYRYYRRPNHHTPYYRPTPQTYPQVLQLYLIFYAPWWLHLHQPPPPTIVISTRLESFSQTKIWNSILPRISADWLSTDCFTGKYWIVTRRISSGHVSWQWNDTYRLFD